MGELGTTYKSVTITDIDSAAGITTPDFQHTRSASLLSDTNAISPGLAVDTNDDARTFGHRLRHQTTSTGDSRRSIQMAQRLG